MMLAAGVARRLGALPPPRRAPARAGRRSTPRTARWPRSPPRARPRPSGCSSLARELIAVARLHATVDAEPRRRDPRAPRCSRATSSSARASAARYYLDKYRFGTRPDLLRPLGEAIAAAVAEHEPEAVRLAAPELGAVPLAAAASLESGLPFVIVRERGEGLRHRATGSRAPSSRASASASSRTSSPRAAPRSRRSRRCARPASRVSTAVCVVDREEGGADALARAAVRLRPLFRASEVRAAAARAHG